MKKSRISFESRIFWLALGVALPGVLAAAALMWLREPTSLAWLGAALPLSLLTLGLAVRLRNRVVFPLYTVSNLLEALREGDYSLRGARACRGDAIGEVIWEVNALSQTLREQRLRVEETVALLGKVLASIDMAILAFDAEQKLRMVNAAGERLLAAPGNRLVGKSAAELGLQDCLASVGSTTLKRKFPGGSGTWDVRRASFREGGLPHELLVVTDLSRALREEERQAWQRLIRVLGHELNNSLAPIKSMAATLASLIGRDPPPADWREDLSSGLALIGARADALTRFMFGYTTLARLPAPRKRRVAMAELVLRVARLEQRMQVLVESDGEFEIDADPDQLEQALINLVKNAADAALPAGGVRVRWSRDAHSAVVVVEDDGPGLSTTENLFVPFFTTKPSGSGIGLVLARQIVEAHGGTLTLSDRAGGASGCVARIALPLTVD